MIVQHRLRVFVLDWIDANLGVSPAQLRSERRYGELVEARCLATWGLRHLGEQPMAVVDIGRALGPHDRPRDRQAVASWSVKAHALRRYDPEFRRACDELAADFSQHREKENAHGIA